MRKAVYVLGGGALGAAVLGGAGFFYGASIPAERAGEAAIMLAQIGAAVGFVAGAGLALWLC
jgi:hypothetical protein